MNRILISLVIFLGLFTNGIGQITNHAYRTVWTLDSIYDFSIPKDQTHIPNSRNRVSKFKYDNSGQILEYIMGRRDYVNGSESIILQQKYTYRYDTRGNINFNENYGYDPQNGWYLRSYVEYFFDSNGNLIKQEWSALDASNQMIVLGKIENVYNVLNQLKLFYRWLKTPNSYDEVKTDYVYYGNGKLKNSLGYGRSGNQSQTSWTPKRRESFMYDSQQRDSLRQIETYYTSTQSFDSVYSVETRYSTSGRIIYRKTHNNTRWINEQFYNYNRNDSLVEVKVVAYNLRSGSAILDLIEKKEYDDFGNLVVWSKKADEGHGFREIFTFTSVFINNLLVAKRDTSFDFYTGISISSSHRTYNLDGKITLQIDSSYHSTYQSELVIQNRYNVDNQKTSLESHGNIRQIGSSTINSTLGGKEEYQYDLNGYLSERKVFKVDTNQQWVHDMLLVFVNDSLGMPIRSQQLRFRADLGTWENWRVDSFLYQPEIEESKLFFPDYKTSLYRDYRFPYKVNERKTEIGVIPGDSIENVYGSIKYYYSEHQIPIYTSSIDALLMEVINLDDMAVLVYPNPVMDYLIVEGVEPGTSSQFLLFDLMGKNILSQIMLTSSIDLTSIKAGKYLYLVVVNDKVYRGKLIKL